MTIRETYIQLLEKNASSHNQHGASDDYKSSLADSRRYLGGLFSNSDDKEQSVSKYFSGGEGETESGNPFLKVARSAFLEAIEDTEFFKTASPVHVAAAFDSFCRELEKISAIKPQTLGQVATKNAIGQGFGKTWQIGGPAGAGGRAAAETAGGLAPKVQAMRQQAALPWYRRLLSSG